MKEHIPGQAPGHWKGYATRAAGVRNLPLFLAAMGENPDRIFGRAGLPRGAIEDPGSWLPGPLYLLLLHEVVRATGDELIGLKLAKDQRVEDLDAVDAIAEVVLDAPTLGRALERTVRFAGLTETATDVRMDGDADTVRLIYRVNSDESRGMRQNADIAMMLGANLIRRAAGEDWSPLAVQLAYPRPAAASIVEEYFAAPVYYGCAENALVIPRELLASPMGGAGLYDKYGLIGEPSIDPYDRLASDYDLATTVKTMTEARLADGDMHLYDIANALRLPPRTLERRLQAQGRSFRAILDDVRRRETVRFLRQGLSGGAEAAALLGYRDIRHFARDFARWFGMSWREYQRMLLGAGEGAALLDSEAV
ncbi:MAG: AraC family transcriptional regulator [Ectothiorhodospiraceae bacterium]|jgi:AraC-like DNA-binding protein